MAWMLKALFSPLAFALGFLAPLIHQILDAAGVSLAGMPNWGLGLSFALLRGAAAQDRGGGRWHTAKR